MAKITIKEALNKVASASKIYTDNSKPDLSVYATTETLTTELASKADFNHTHGKYATAVDVDNAIAGLVNSAPSTLDTLNELAAALGNDANFATTVTNQIATKVTKEEGKGLSANDLTDASKNNYDSAYIHSQSVHAPSNAQKNSDITKAEIETKLTGTIITHDHNAANIATDAIHRFVTDDQINTWNNNSGGSATPSFGDWTITQDINGNLNFTYNG